jgi:hypothetical protein
MKVFLSWSGDASRRVAELLRRYLHLMIQSLDPFMSKRDIGSGTRWASELAQELDQTTFGIVCLTPENLDEPWLLFEAGALAKHVEEARVCCLLLRGLTPVQVTGPLAQFQNREFTKDEFLHLLRDLNDRLDAKRLEPEGLTEIFDQWWPKLEKDVAKTLDDPKLGAPVQHKRSQLDILEELLLRIRNVERYLENDPAISPPIRSKIADHFDFYNTVRSLNSVIQLMGNLSGEQLLVLREFFSPGYERTRIKRRSNLTSRHSESDIESLITRGYLVKARMGAHDILRLRQGLRSELEQHLKDVMEDDRR